MKFKILVALLLASASVSNTFAAEAPGPEQDKLDQYYQAQELKQSQLEEYENEAYGYETKLDQARKELKEAEAEFDAAKKAEVEARIAYAGDESQDNERAVRLAEHALAMAERGVRNRAKRLTFAEERLAELDGSQQALKTELADLQKRIKTQEAVVREAESRQDAEQKRLLAKAEAARLEAAKRRAADAPKAAPEKVAKAAPAPAVAAAATPEERKAAAIEALSDLDRQALGYISTEMERFKQLSLGSNARPLYRFLNLQGDKVKTTDFEHRGRDQYWAEAVVSKGPQEFRINNFKFSRIVPAAHDGETYVFIFDSKRASRPRLIMFKKSLLDLI
ncbi:hypothetical protein [Pseudomaricurvus sp. HS19]|uniref:hypothetical protein n=1 Tax=Pseudomaricurvus sp. HS19 TaxID=2692626 RepID=UPI00136B972E|nr:hypothetical protein [Pseudomaricurvus sp. HS19]MYM62312.1 hypothetical protein [Pseudomaricurvus sp. HS19]